MPWKKGSCASADVVAALWTFHWQRSLGCGLGPLVIAGAIIAVAADCVVQSALVVVVLGLSQAP